MLIPKLFREMIQAGAAFSLTITDGSGKCLTFKRRREEGANIPLFEVEKADPISSEASECGLLTIFKAVEAMTEDERDANGVRLRPGGFVVNPRGAFARAFDAKRYSTYSRAFYVGPKDQAGKCQPRHAWFLPLPEGQEDLFVARAWERAKVPAKKPLWRRKRTAAIRDAKDGHRVAKYAKETEPQHDEQHPHGCPLAFPAPPQAGDPGSVPEGLDD